MGYCDGQRDHNETYEEAIEREAIEWEREEKRILKDKINCTTKYDIECHFIVHDSTRTPVERLKAYEYIGDFRTSLNTKGFTRLDYMKFYRLKRRFELEEKKQKELNEQ